MNKIVEMLFGSALYGTSTPQSDTDIKAIYIPTAREIVLHSYQNTIHHGRSKEEKERNTADDVDIEIFSLDRYLELLGEGQTVAIDMLFAHQEMYLPLNDGDHSSHIWRAIIDNKDKFLNKNANAFIGYSKKQAAKYGVKGSRMEALERILAVFEGKSPYDSLHDHWDEIAIAIAKSTEFVSLEKEPLLWFEPKLSPDKKTMIQHLKVNGKYYPIGQRVGDVKTQLEKKYKEYGERAQKAHLDGGRDYKALSHAVRVNGEGLELLRTGHVTFPRPDRELLLKIKLGKMPWEELSAMIEQGLVDLVEASKVSALREAPDQEWINNFVAEVYSSVVKES